MKKIHIPFLFSVILMSLASACSSSDDDNDDVDTGTEQTIKAVEAFPSLTFTSPVDIKQSPDASNRFFVVEQQGVIKVFENVSYRTSIYIHVAPKVVDFYLYHND